MIDREREQLQNRLRELANAPPGLHIDTPSVWEIKGVKDPRLFFMNLALLMKRGSILYLEGTAIHPEAASFYGSHEAEHPCRVLPFTVFPASDSYHLNFTEALAAGILDLIARRPTRDLFDHIAGYRQGRMTFCFFDAFQSYLVISGDEPEVDVNAFSVALGASYFRRLNKINPNPYRVLLDVLGHRVNISMPRRRWWREFMNGFLEGFRNG